MIELNKNTQKCVQILSMHCHGRKLRRHATRQLFSLLLLRKCMEADEGVKRKCEKERMTQLWRPSVFGKVEEGRFEYEDYHHAVAELIVMAVGFLRKTGVRDVERLIRYHIEKK